MGRRKIEMKMIPSKHARQVAFSKRRTSLFKKANELCTLTGAQVALIVFSPGGKPYSFGHPDVGTIISTFLNGRPTFSDYEESHVSALNEQYNVLREQVEVERRRGEELKQRQREMHERFWFTAPTDHMNLDQLRLFKLAMEDLREKVKKKREELQSKAATLAPSTTTNFVRAFDLNVPNPVEMDD